jgi:hypothetical protein
METIQSRLSWNTAVITSTTHISSINAETGNDTVEAEFRTPILGNKECKDLGEHSDAITIRFEVDRSCFECNFFEYVSYLLTSIYEDQCVV